MTFKIVPVPEDHKQDWKIYLDGKLAPVKCSMVRITSRFAEIIYGLRPEGYDSIIFREGGKGGVSTLPYCIDKDGNLLVGLVRETRPNLSDKPIWNAMGGMIDEGEQPQVAQAREAFEESGLDMREARLLSGAPSVMDRLWSQAEPDRCAGRPVYAMEIPARFLHYNYDYQGRVPYKRLGDNHIKNPNAEGALGFFKWQSAVKLTPDQVTRAAIALLLADLH